jgi:CRP/FNR family transcriptional regulator
MKKILDVISTIPLFNGLPEDQLEAIKKIAIEKQLNKGEMVVSEGDEGRGFFVIAEGRIKVFKVSAEGKEQRGAGFCRPEISCPCTGN